jgi:hypothetical protein
MLSCTYFADRSGVWRTLRWTARTARHAPPQWATRCGQAHRTLWLARAVACVPVGRPDRAAGPGGIIWRARGCGGVLSCRYIVHGRLSRCMYSSQCTSKFLTCVSSKKCRKSPTMSGLHSCKLMRCTSCKTPLHRSILLGTMCADSAAAHQLMRGYCIHSDQ